MIRFDNVTKSYKGKVVALREISLEISQGEFVFIVGASGSGKTTMLRLLLREERIDSGRIWVAGRDIGRLPKWRIPYLRRNLGCVFQDFRLLPNKTVFANVAFALQVIGRPREIINTQVPQVLDLVGLGQKAGRLPEELSGGEQQRVAIARAFVNRPLILLADEPTGNLDPTTSQEIMSLLERINRTGTTVLMASHDASVVDKMRRRVVEIDAGRIIRDQARGIYGTDPVPSSTRGVPAVIVSSGAGLRPGRRGGTGRDGASGRGAGAGRGPRGAGGDGAGRDAAAAGAGAGLGAGAGVSRPRRRR